MDQNKFFLVFKKINIINFIVIFLIFFLDRIIKIEVINNQIDNKTVYLNKFINIDLVWNTGIGFGLLSSNSTIFYNSLTILIGAIIIFLIYLMIKSNATEKLLFSIVIGGALGNFYDRAVYYAVPDFIDMHIQNFHWFTFNIADIFITIGLLLLIFKDLIFKHEKK